MIEDALVEKMEKQKYDPYVLKSEVRESLLKFVTHLWTNSVQIERNIREHTLRQIMHNLFDKEVKEEISKHVSRHTPRFKAFQNLANKVKDVFQTKQQRHRKTFLIMQILKEQRRGF